ncbi:MAG TPA: helix-turn-helix transcriptional regulator [Candidatus Cybelea sp.]|nr:helix-turn-helix transcriptional regulator [Candidatus Cybelea sp.]
MGILLRFPGRRAHVRAPSAVSRISASASKVRSDIPFDEANWTSGRQCFEGMPRRRQVLTVGSGSERAEATALVPPSESMTESVVIMEPNLVRTVRTCQEFATGETTFIPEYGPMEPMQDPNDIIAARLRALRKELGERQGIQGGYSQTEFAEELGLTKSTYNPFETCKRALTFETACLIRRRFGVPIDWLFFGEMPKIENSVLFKLGPQPKAPVRARRTASQK